jgi:cell division protein YceG involved in septum cleavage
MVSYNFFYKVFTDTCVNPSDLSEVQFVIPPDTSTSEIVDLLVEDGLVNDKYVMLAKVYLSSYHGKMLPGTYILSKSMTQTEILKTITGTSSEDEDEE